MVGSDASSCTPWNHPPESCVYRTLTVQLTELASHDAWPPQHKHDAAVGGCARATGVRQGDWGA